MPAHSSDLPVLHPYCRVSDPTQVKGGGLLRQTNADEAIATACNLFGFRRSRRLRVDDGVSAFKGLNLTPEHELGQFLAEAQQGLIRPGDALAIENYDRMSRQDPWAAIGLVNSLRELRIHIVRLDRMKMLRYDSTDPGDFFECAVEFMRGNSESAAKSMRNGDRWARKREAARKEKKPMTHRLPAWIEERDGQLLLIPERVLTIQRIFKLAAVGYGMTRIVGTLTREGYPPFGACEAVLDADGNPVLHTKGRRKGKPKLRAPEGSQYGAGKWTLPYVARLLKDRRVLGEFQPCGRGRKPEGSPVLGYYPAAITEDEWHDAHAGLDKRRKGGRFGRGRPTNRIGKHINLFAGILWNARARGDTYIVGDLGKGKRVLRTSSAQQGRGSNYSFPLPTFETAILSLLREINPHDILNGDQGPDATLALSAHLSRVEAELAEANAFMDEHGFSPSIGKRITALEVTKGELAEQLAEARQKAAHPLSESWGEVQTLAEALETAPAPEDARLRLRTALRRIVDGVWLLVVPRGRDRLCAVQVWFAGGKRHRDYLIFYRAAGNCRPSSWWARSLADVATLGPLNLRNAEHAVRLEAALLAAPMDRMQ